MKIQSRRKSNKCGQRNFTTSKTANLNNHMKMHSGRKSNKCGQCKFAIAEAAKLRTHKRVHSWEKPNKCHHCNYSSTQANTICKYIELTEPEQFGQCNNEQRCSFELAEASCKKFVLFEQRKYLQCCSLICTKCAF